VKRLTHKAMVLKKCINEIIHELQIEKQERKREKSLLKHK